MSQTPVRHVMTSDVITAAWNTPLKTMVAIVVRVLRWDSWPTARRYRAG
jgi:hypothetical protein